MIALRALIAIAVLPGVVAVLIPWRIVRDASISDFAWLGAIPIGVGLVLFGWCVLEFARRGRGTLAPWDSPRRFVAVGPYRFVRNPMYLAVVSVIVGEAIIFGSPALMLYLAVLVAGFHAFVVLYEEPRLEREFGGEYRAYRSTVPRWIPRGVKR
jgi:protein-S-isoprenylcysteine O-methyltransferase Ste14